MPKWISLPDSVRHVGGLSLATIVGQAVLLVASPFITRLYSPDEFGSFSVLVGAATLLATLSSFSYPIAIPLAGTQREASELLWMTFLTSVIIAPAGTILASRLVLHGGTASLPAASWLVVGGTAVLLAAWGGLRALAAREHQFQSVGMSGVMDSGVQAGAQLGFGHLHLGPMGLSSGYLAGKVAAVAFLLWRARGYLLTPHRPWVSGRRWMRYSLLVTPTTLLNQASVTAVSPFIALLFGASTAGHFSLATRMLAVPSALLGQAVATVFFPKIAQMAREGRPTLPAVGAVASSLASVAIPVFSVTALLGPELFAFVFGSEWREAGIVAAILSPWLALSLISSPISSVVTVWDRLGQLLLLGVVEASLRFAALAAGAGFGNWHFSMAAYSVVGCTISLYTTAWVLRLSGGSLWAWLASWPKTNWVFLGAVSVLSVLKPLVSPLPFIVAACVLCAFGLLAGARSLVRLTLP